VPIEGVERGVDCVTLVAVLCDGQILGAWQRGALGRALARRPGVLVHPLSMPTIRDEL